MNRDESRLKLLLTGAAAFLLMTGALLYLFLGDTAVAQSIRLSRVQKYQGFLVQRLSPDPRFRSIKVGVSLSSGGASVLIQGQLPRETDLDALKEVVDATQPPAHVQYRVVIAPDR